MLLPMRLTFWRSLVLCLWKRKAVPSPRRHGSKGLERLQTCDIYAERKVSISNLQRRFLRTGRPLGAESADYGLPVDGGRRGDGHNDEPSEH